MVLLFNTLETNLFSIIIFLITLSSRHRINSRFLCLVQIIWKTVSVIPELFFGTAYLLKCGRLMTLVLFCLTARITLIYNKLLHDNITKTYKHGSEDNISEINNELKHIADKLSIGNRIECMKKREAFLFLLRIIRKILKTTQNAD